MLEKNFMEKAIDRIENKNNNRPYYNIIFDKELDGEQIVESFGINEKDEIYDEAVSFCDDYIELDTDKKENKQLIYKLKDKYVDSARILLNTALYAGLGSIVASDPTFTFGAAGFGLGMTTYDELKDHSAIDMKTNAFFGVVGGFVGSLFTDSETGKYIGAGVGAFYAGLKQVYNNKYLKDKYSNFSKDEALEDIISKYDRKKEKLIDMYS